MQNRELVVGIGSPMKNRKRSGLGFFLTSLFMFVSAKAAVPAPVWSAGFGLDARLWQPDSCHIFHGFASAWQPGFSQAASKPSTLLPNRRRSSPLLLTLLHPI
jgi:hypothetical protein